MPRFATPLACGALALVAFLLPSTAAAQATCTAAAGSPAAPASWNSAATWSCTGADADGIPDADDNVVVNAVGFTVILTQNEAAANLTLTPGSSGSPSFNSDRIRTAGFTLDVNGTYNTSIVSTISPINTTVSGGGRVRFVGAGRTFLGTNIGANYPAWRAEVATTGTSSFATGNLKFGALIVSSGTMDVTGDLRIDNGTDGSGDGITIAAGATLIARGITNRRSASGSASFGGPITVNGTFEMRGNTLNGNSITINGTFRRSTSTLALSSNNVSGTIFNYASGATLEYTGASGRMSVGAEAKLSGASVTVNGTAGEPIPNLVINNASGLDLNLQSITVTERLIQKAGNISSSTGSTVRVLYGPGAVLEYAGTAAQTAANPVNETNRTIPLEWPAVAAESPTTVVVNNASGVTLAAARTTTNLTLTNGVFTPNATLTLASGGSVTRTGGSIASGTGSIAYPAGAALSYTGSSEATVGDEWPATNGPASVTINNAAGVVLSGPRTLTGGLTFTDGTLTLGANTLTLADGATIGGADAGDFIVTNGAGTLTVEGLDGTDGSVLFPVGASASSYTPAALSNSGAADAFSVRVSPTYSNAPEDATLAIGREFDVSEGTAGGSSATLTLAYDPATTGASFNPANPVVIAHFTGGVWTEIAGTATTLDGQPAITGGPFTSFSPFSGGNSGALPVELTAFTATAAGPGVARLAWTTASETDNAGFQAERQTATGAWTAAGAFVAGHGTTSEAHAYAVDIDGLAPGTHRFRLRQTDLDGTTVTVASVEATIGIEGAFALVVRGMRSADLTVAAPQAVRAVLYDALGRAVARLHDGPVDGTVRLPLPDGVADGVYFLRVTGERFATTRSIVLR